MEMDQAQAEQLMAEIMSLIAQLPIEMRIDIAESIISEGEQSEQQEVAPQSIPEQGMGEQGTSPDQGGMAEQDMMAALEGVL